jgi:twitching motility protein PilI
MQEAVNLRDLREKPFELLLELERRSRQVVSGQDPDSDSGFEIVGVAFRMGGDHFLTPREEVREVLKMPDSLTRVPGTRPWVKGMANVRGQLLPVIDMRDFLGSGVAEGSRSARVLIVNHKDTPAGMIVDEVFGFRRFVNSEFTDEWPPTIIRCERYLAGAYKRGQESWPLFSLRQLVESPEFMNFSQH